MTRLISKLLFLLTLAFGSTSFGQGRVDSDPILHNIWWTTYKIDSNKELTYTINSNSGQNKLTKVTAYYSKRDSVYKIIELMTIPLGTQMTSSYFIMNKPIFISVVKKDYHLTVDKEQFFKVVASFDNISDTNQNQQKKLYKDFYQAKYFFYHDSVRYANIMTENKIRVDNKNDKNEGLKLYYLWTKLLVAKQ